MPEMRCTDCPLRQLPPFLNHTPQELELVQSLKRREMTVAAGETLIHEGQTDAPLFTLRVGWAFRFKTLRKLELRGLHSVVDGRLYMRDVKALARLADLYGDGRPAQRPLV